MGTFLQTFLSLDFTIIAIVSAFFGATANIAARTLLKSVRSYDIVGLSFLMMGATLLLFSPLFYQFEPSWKTILLLYSIGIIDTAANYFYFRTFEKTEASTATPLLSLAPIFTFIGSWIFLSENTSVLNIVLCLVIVISIVGCSINLRDIQKFRSQTLIPALLASFLFGISAIPAKELLTIPDAINAPTLYMFRATIIGMIALIFMRSNLQNLTTKHYIMIWLRGLLVIITWTLLYYALTHGNAGVTVTLANITPIFTIFLGALFLKEKITFQKIIAAALIILASGIIIFA